MKKRTAVFLACLIFTATMFTAYGWAENVQATRTGADEVSFDRHPDVFVKPAAYQPSEPLFGDRGLITKPFERLVHGADHMIGRSFRTKTYTDEDEHRSSFVSLKSNGAQVGYDF